MVSTVARRDEILRLFERWCHENHTPWEDCTAEDIRQMLHWRGDLAPRTRATYLSTLRCFYDWLMELGLVEENPARKVRAPRLPRMLPRPISDADLARALRAAHALEIPPWLEGRARVHPLVVVLTLAAFAGLRCKEIADLFREDLREGGSDPVVIVTHGKGGHQRIIPMHPRIAELCPLLPRSGQLMWTRRGFAPSAERVSQWGNHFLDQLEIDATMHQLRHWFGSATYDQCRDLRVVQELLGHRSPTITAGYARWSPETGRAAVSDIDPHPPAA